MLDACGKAARFKRDLTERTLGHLSGYRGARPVRVGKGAWNQQQHDAWGMILDALDVQFRRAAAQIVAPVWDGLAGFVDAALQHWREPDQGIWEVRGEPKHFVASKVMCWVAAARGAYLAEERGNDEREEGTITICSFWLVSALVMIGETDRACALCQKLLSFAGPLLLYAEEIDPTTGQHPRHRQVGVI
jgi:GH15 family glucan-1,4-alpha-glucosidase